VKTEIQSCSVALRELVRRALVTEPDLDVFFDPGKGGGMTVSLVTPQGRIKTNSEGVSLWLYRLHRGERTLNFPARRLAADRFEQLSLPLRLHHLVAPIASHDARPQAPEPEQHILGKALQVFHDLRSASALRPISWSSRRCWCLSSE
jgi:hypothetical protein